MTAYFFSAQSDSYDHQGIIHNATSPAEAVKAARASVLEAWGNQDEDAAETYVRVWQWAADQPHEHVDAEIVLREPAHQEFLRPGEAVDAETDAYMTLTWWH